MSSTEGVFIHPFCIVYVCACAIIQVLTDTQSYGHEGTADPRPRKPSRTCWMNNGQRICTHSHIVTLHTEWNVELSKEDAESTRTQLNLHSTWLRKDVGMYVHHKVPSCRVLHDKAHMLRRLETCKQVDQEGVVRAVDGLKDPLLAHQTGERRRRGGGG